MNSFFYALTESVHEEVHAFGLNSNFLEANVINILLLLWGLIYILKNFLGSTLLSRQQKVFTAIQESEQRLKEANNRLEEAEKQLAQTQIIISQIINDSKITAQKVKDSILAQGKMEIEKLTTSGKNSIANAEQQIKKQIKKQIATLAIHRVTLQLKTQMNNELQAKIINTDIMKLKYE
uniref:ATP synthase CFO B chain subunit I n=1 Tax=Kumanoa americana TaxID=1196377 RepID=A0A1C9CGF5_9FLOR|nr:ATP synthase CFO B chain subunit I [Kumanoa americana]AOM67480.1 ATP synthase CFO B chain subunit I [Kumanoa americana]